MAAMATKSDVIQPPEECDINLEVSSQAIGEASAPCHTPAEPPGLAVQAKRSLLGGGFCGCST